MVPLYPRRTEGIPHFTPHGARSVVATNLGDRKDIAPRAASAMLAHAGFGDDDPKLEKLSPTTEVFYTHAQRITLKIEAMKAWSDALIAECNKIHLIWSDFYYN
jgi:hypothetical protein